MKASSQRVDPRRVDPRRVDLNRRLVAYRPGDARDAEHHGRMQDLAVNAQGDPFSRKHFDPGHFTASAFVLAPGGDELLLVLHAKLGRWLQPGGHVDPGDRDVLAAARRELAEEVDLTDLALARGHEGVFDLDVHSIPEFGTEGRHEHFDLRFLFEATGRHFKAGSDALQAAWVPLGEVQELETDESVLRAIRRILARRSLG